MSPLETVHDSERNRYRAASSASGTTHWISFQSQPQAASPCLAAATECPLLLPGIDPRVQCCYHGALKQTLLLQVTSWLAGRLLCHRGGQLFL